MTELTIRENDAGGRLDKYLGRFLHDAPASFIYKMLRKKNITLNGKKALGSEKLAVGDSVKLFLSDETVVKFGGKVSAGAGNEGVGGKNTSVGSDPKFTWPLPKPSIIYEDKDILILNKPADVLSQPAYPGDLSLNDWILEYMKKNGFTEEDYATVHPSVANRLDRNTSGVIMAGKTLPGLRFLSEMIKSRKVDKYYLTLVKGVITEKKIITAYLVKSKSHNQVKIYDTPVEGGALIKTEYRPLDNNGKYTLLLVKLITGKSHQIRAHLAFTGHPVFGDSKYGLKSESEAAKRLGLKRQFLHSYITVFPSDITGDFLYMAGRRFVAPLPDDFNVILERMGLVRCLRGIQEG